MYYQLYYFFYNLGIFNLYYRKFTLKLSNNYTSFNHAFLSICFLIYYFLYNQEETYNHIRGLSTGYFMFDLLFMFINKPLNLYYLSMIYHHIISIYGLNIDSYCYQEYLLFFAEISNIPSYLVYHNIHTKGKNLLFWKNVQVVVYNLIRVPVLGYLLYLNYFHTDSREIAYLITPVYFMGLAWSFTLISKTANFTSLDKKNN